MRSPWVSVFIALSCAVAAPAETLRVGLDPRSPPWSFLPGNQNTNRAPRMDAEQIARLQGIDIDVIKALGRGMGVRMQIVTTRWKDLEAELLQGRFDLIVNAWTPSLNTPPGIVASAPYYDWGLLVAARADDTSIRSAADLGQKRIGHFPDPAVLPALRAMGLGLGAELDAVGADTSGMDVFQKLSLGAFDAVIYDSAFVRWQVARDPRFKVVGQPLNRLGYHVGVRQTDAALLARVEAAVRSFVASPEAEGRPPSLGERGSTAALNAPSLEGAVIASCDPWTSPSRGTWPAPSRAAN